MEKKPEIDYAATMAAGFVAYGPETGALGSTEISEVERVMNAFEAHESEEAKFTRRYKEIAEKYKNPLVKFLLQLIISDEEKHHAVTHAIMSTLKGSLNWTNPEDAITGLYDLVKEKDELLRITEDFIQLERKGIKEYKTLIKACDRYYQGLFTLLLKTMIDDSEKHVEILEFLREKLEER
jgi:bacterioferritin (cytochrome b1)